MCFLEERKCFAVSHVVIMELSLDFSFFFCFLALPFPASGLGRKCTAASTQCLSPSQRAVKVWELVNGAGLTTSFLSLWELAQHNSSLWLHSCIFPAAYLCDSHTQKAFCLVRVKQHLEALCILQFSRQRQGGFQNVILCPVIQKLCHQYTLSIQNW